jgi:ribosomal protein S18 acetylase RimI-like enzyme
MAALFEAQLLEHGIRCSVEGLTSTLRLVCDQPHAGFILTATSDGAVVAVAYAACILSLEHSGWSGWLEELYVLPEWRERGLGTQLLDAVLAAAHQRGWVALDLEVDSEHQRAISLYQRRGFQPVSRTRFVRRLEKDTAH